jgi:hypothetical protein
MSHWLGKVWIRIRNISVILPLFLFHLKNRVYLSRGVQVAGAAWWAVTRIMAGVGDLMQRIMDGRTGQVLGGRTIGRSGDAVCGLHRARGDKERGFLGWASKPRLTVSQWVGLKTPRTVFSGLISKLAATVWWFGSQNHRDGFLVCASKSSRLRFVCCATKPTGGRRRGTRVEI